MSKQIKKIVLPEDFRVLAEGHSFNVSIARAFGLTEAILLQNFHYWHQCNKGNDDMFKDGRVWFFRSIAQIVECYPYLSPDKVRYAIERLIESGFLLKGNYSEDKLKKACWYSLSDETLSLFGENNIPFGKIQNDLVNSQLNYNNKDIDNNIEKEKEEDKSSSQKKDDIDFAQLVTLWNANIASCPKMTRLIKMSDKRKKAIRLLLKSCDSNVEELARFIKSLPYADDWVRGESKDKNWAMDFDWLVSNTNNWYVKALEGEMHKKNIEMFNRIMNGEELTLFPDEKNETIELNGVKYR